MKKILSLLLCIILMLGVLPYGARASVIVASGGEKLNVFQNYESGSGGDFAYGCYSSGEITESDNSMVWDLNGQKQLEASVEGLEKAEDFTLEFDVKALFASSELRIFLKKGALNYGIRIHPGTFADLYEKKRSDFPKDSNIYKSMWMNSAAAKDEHDLVADKWYSFKINVKSELLGTEYSDRNVLNAVKVFYKEKGENGYRVLNGSTVEAPWKAGWNPAALLLCNKKTCNVAVRSAADGGQQYAVWSFDEGNDTIDKTTLASKAHYQIDNIGITSGMYPSKGVIHHEDFEGENPSLMFDGFSTIETDEKGNRYLKIDIPERTKSGVSKYMSSEEITAETLPEGFIMTADLCMLDENSVDFKLEYFSDSFGTTNQDGEMVAKTHGDYALSRYDWNVGDWYRLRLVKFPHTNEPVTTIMNLTTGEIKHINVKGNSEANLSDPRNFNRFFIRSSLYNDTRVFRWAVDNFTLTDLGAISLISANKTGDTLTAEISADAAIGGNANGAEIAPVLAVYKDGALVATDKGDAVVDGFGGIRKKFALSGDFQTAKILLWDFENGGIPLAEVLDITNDIVLEGENFAPSGYTPGFFQDFYELGEWKLNDQSVITHDPVSGTVRMTTRGENSIRREIKRSFNPPADYDVEFRLMFPKLPEDAPPGGTWLSVSAIEAHTWINIWDNVVYFMHRSFDGQEADYEGPNYAVPFEREYDKWQTWRAEVRDGFVTWFVDGKELVSYEMLKDRSINWNRIEIWHKQATAHMSDVVCDWVRYTPYFEQRVKLLSPSNSATFAEGEKILLKASRGGDTGGIDFYVNDFYVGSGSAENGFEYTLDGLKAGKYTLKAKSGVFETVEYEFTVTDTFDGELSADKTEVKFGESVNLEVNCNENAQKAEFFLNGQLLATDNDAPFEATMSGMKIGTNTVMARVYSTEGFYKDTDVKEIAVAYDGTSEFDIGGEYEINYTINGSGSLKLRDGYFTLNFSHGTNKFTYRTSSGTKTYNGIGAGDYKIVVTSGYAELYYNGQFVVSWLLPYEAGVVQLTKSGLTDFELTGSGVKTPIIHKNWNGESEFSSEYPFNQEFYSIEFDKKDTSAETVFLSDGMFENTLYFRNNGIYAKNQHTLGADVAEIKLCDTVEAGYYRVTVGFGIARLYRNNEYIGGYRLVLNSSKPRFSRTVTKPATTTFVAVKTTEDVYYHSENFEETAELSYEDYWSAHPENYRDGADVKLTTQRNSDESGNHYVTIDGTGLYLLNAIEKNPVFRWRGMANKAEGKVYAVFRYSFADRQSRIGYDFNSDEWFFERLDESGGVAEAFRKGGSVSLEENLWYNFELVADENNVKLLANGEEVISCTLEPSNVNIYYGRLGFGAENGTYSFDDVYYEGVNRATPGLSYTNGGRFGIYDTTNTAALYYEDDEGNVVATGYRNSLITKDKGKTWEELVLPDDSDTKGRLFEEQMVRLPNGNLVRLRFAYGAVNGYIRAYISEDNGKTWSDEKPIYRGFGGLGAVSRFTSTMDGKLYICTAKGTEEWGEGDLFYSEDGGNTWNKSETTFSTHNTGIILNECIVVDTPRKNEVWMYTRSNSGFLDYFISKDGGKTFDTTPRHSGLVAPASCFRIERDWNNPDTYYAIFIYDAGTLNQRHHNNPRCRVAIAVSYDGMKNWDYVTDLMEASDWPFIHTSDSILNIIDGVIYWRTSSAHDGHPGTNFGAVQINKIKPLKRMPSLHDRYFVGFDPISDGADDLVILPKSDGMAWIYGRYGQAEIADGRCSIKTAENIFGITVDRGETSVTASLGEGKAVFTSDNVLYTMNGEIVRAERPVFAEGYFDIKELCRVFDRTIRETDDFYVITTKGDAVERYQTMFESLNGN